MHLGRWHWLQSLLGALTVPCAGVTLPYRCLPARVVPVSKLEWQTEARGYCRETDGKDPDELSVLVALKQKQRTDEIIQNQGWRSHTACIPNSPCTNQPCDPGEVTQCLYEMAGGGGTATPDQGQDEAR